MICEFCGEELREVKAYVFECVRCPATFRLVLVHRGLMKK